MPLNMHARDGFPLDRTGLTRAQATSETVIQALNLKFRATAFHREWSIYTPVRLAIRRLHYSVQHLSMFRAS